MGDNALSGLLPGGPLSVFEFSESKYDDIWAASEAIVGGLIDDIQPSRQSEDKRRAVIEYVDHLIRNNFDCKVCVFGSVPLKTYLPDGDIDLTAFSWLPQPHEAWAESIKNILKHEEMTKNAKHSVKEVQIIHAEVQIVKCLVDNIIVDISFNQLGGLCTLCFLEEVDRLIGRDHLFKRSIILVKAWCYYESRILGAHHGLISTYALETLVLYIFNIFHSSLRGPFEVLHKFLLFFSMFDWEHYCLSIWGPIHLSVLHNMTVEPPQKNGGELLLTHEFLAKCSQMYRALPLGVQDFPEKLFSSKNMNVMDPLRVTNNLGRSVNKGNFFRICRAFTYGAKQIGKLLSGPLDEVGEKLDDFFRNTKKHCDRYQSDSVTPELRNLILPALSDEQEHIDNYEASQVDREITDASLNTPFVSFSERLTSRTQRQTEGMLKQNSDTVVQIAKSMPVNGGGNVKDWDTMLSAACTPLSHETEVTSQLGQEDKIDTNKACEPCGDILAGDFEMHLFHLHACRLMITSHFYGPLMFSPVAMFHAANMFGPFATETPWRPLNAEANMVAQVLTYNHQPYVNASLQGLSIHNTFALPTHGLFWQGRPNVQRGTGTYLPNMKSGTYRQAGNSKGPTVPESNSSLTSDGASSSVSNPPHGRTNHEKQMNTAKLTAQSGTSGRYPSDRGWKSTQKERIPARSSNVHANGDSVFICQQDDVKNVEKQLDGLCISDHHDKKNNGFMVDNMDFGPIHLNSAASNREGASYGFKKYNVQGQSRIKYGDYKQHRDADEKDQTTSQQRSFQYSYELKEEDFPPLDSRKPSQKPTICPLKTPANGLSQLQTCTVGSFT